MDICLYIVYAQMFCLYWSRFVTTRQDPLFKSDLTLLTPTAATPLQIQHDPAMPKSLRSPLWRNAAWCRMNLGYRLFLVYLLVTFPSGTPFWPTCFMCCIAEGLLVMSPFFCARHILAVVDRKVFPILVHPLGQAGPWTVNSRTVLWF